MQKKPLLQHGRLCCSARAAERSRTCSLRSERCISHARDLPVYAHCSACALRIRESASCPRNRNADIILVLSWDVCTTCAALLTLSILRALLQLLLSAVLRGGRAARDKWCASGLTAHPTPCPPVSRPARARRTCEPPHVVRGLGRPDHPQRVHGPRCGRQHRQVRDHEARHHHVPHLRARAPVRALPRAGAARAGQTGQHSAASSIVSLSA